MLLTYIMLKYCCIWITKQMIYEVEGQWHYCKGILNLCTGFGSTGAAIRSLMPRKAWQSTSSARLGGSASSQLPPTPKPLGMRCSSSAACRGTATTAGWASASWCVHQPEPCIASSTSCLYVLHCRARRPMQGTVLCVQNNFIGCCQGPVIEQHSLDTCAMQRTAKLAD